MCGGAREELSQVEGMQTRIGRVEEEEEDVGGRGLVWRAWE